MSDVRDPKITAVANALGVTYEDLEQAIIEIGGGELDVREPPHPES